MANIITRAAHKAVKILADKSPWGAMTSPWMVPVNYNVQDYLKIYGEIGWLFGCVSRIGQAVGEAELRLYVERTTTKGVERERIYKHPLLDLLNYVNPFQTGYEFQMLTQFYMELVGNAFWYVVNNRMGVPAELWLIPPAYMHPVPDPQQFLKGWVFRAGTTEIPFDLDEVIWLSYPNPANPYWGIGPAQSIAVDLQTEAFSSRWNRNYFYNDAAIGTTIIYPDEIQTEEYERLKEQWSTRHQGLGKAHKVAILSGGAKIEKAVISQRDMDFHKMRKLNRDNILGAYGMPLSVMGVSENVNRANAESGEYVFARWTIKPRLTLRASKLTEQLASRYDKKLIVEYVNPVPEDREQARKEIDSGINSSYITINEARERSGMNPIEGADVLLIPSNKVPIRIENNKFPEVLPVPAPAGGGPAKAPKALMRSWTDEQKADWWTLWVDKAFKQENIIRDNLRSMFKKQEAEALGNVTEGGGDNQTLINQAKSRKAYTAAVTDELTKLVTESFEDATEGEPPEHPHTDKLLKQDEPPPEPFSESMKWLKTRIGWAAKEVSEETAKLLADQLAAGFAEGESMVDIRKRVQSVFTFCDKTRALRIARTETIMAANEGALRGYESVDVNQVEFVAALDERNAQPGEPCRELNGDIFSLKDAHGMIPIHPNCRCTWVPVTD